MTIPTATKKFTYLSMPHFLKFWILPAQLNLLQATLAGAGFAFVLALITAGPIVRLAGVAAGIATLAILVIVHEFDYQTSAVTRGTSTQIGVVTPSATTTFLSVLAWVLIFIAVAFAFQQSKFGLRLRASRENERAAKSVGVRVSIERQDSTIRYVVADDGPGVSSEERERIFEAGVRGRLGEEAGLDGAGLGLSLSRRLARSTTGDVEALPGTRGGRFLVRLPAA